jgi:enoyl-CoA hydratase/carnithine racemase
LIMSVTVERDGHLLLIGIDRAHKRNAWDLATLEAVCEAYEILGTDPDLRVGVLFGHGEHFSAGLDLEEVSPALLADGPLVLARGGCFDPFGLWKPPVPKPVVLALQGISFTLAIELALSSDVVVAAEDVRLRQLEVGRGIVPLGGATLRAPLQLGWANAMRWLLTGEEFGAAEALRIGLVQEVVTKGEQLTRAVAIARTIARQAPLAVQQTLFNARMRLRAAEEQAAREHLESITRTLLTSEDAAEGVASFVERRAASFRGQ